MPAEAAWTDHEKVRVSLLTQLNPCRILALDSQDHVGRSFPRGLFLKQHLHFSQISPTLHFNIVKMALIQSQTPKLFARDIVRYSDAELDQYLEANGRSGFPNIMISRVAKVYTKTR